MNKTKRATKAKLYPPKRILKNRTKYKYLHALDKVKSLDEYIVKGARDFYTRVEYYQIGIEVRKHPDYFRFRRKIAA